VLLNGEHRDGVVLYSKHSPVTEKEIEHRFIADKKQWDIVASNPKQYNRFTINSYDDYLHAMQNSTTDLFWGIPDDVIVESDFDFDWYFSHHNRFDRNINHVLLNGEHRDGIVLYSKNSKVSKREVEHRFFANKKQWDVVASRPKQYDRFTINSYEDYTQALKNSQSEMFWGIPSDVIVESNFDFDLYFTHYNKFDRDINHVFLNDKSRDGVVLFSKNSPVSEKEIDHRFIVNKKEWNIVASVPKPYDRFSIKTYEDYLQALERSETEMFWIINPDIHLREDFDWNFYIDHHNRYERQINHVWLNGEYYDGVVLTSKQIQLSKKEIDFRFLANKKEYTTIASDPVPFDIVFISYNEPNADENYELLKQRYSNAMRVHGVQGIHQAHIEAAKLANTDMFWVIDGDAQLLDSFDFDYQLAHYDIDGRNTVHVWRSFNPVNNLVYGYGGVKLLPTELTLNMSTDTSDMTTSISDKFKAVPAMSNSTVFNTDAFNAWKSGFRECCKLASRSIDRQVDNETEFRLNAWCTRGADKDYGKETILGAQQGKEYGELHKDNPDALQRINDFDWLYDLFKQSCQSVE
jgi:CYTH domain-containing protein